MANTFTAPFAQTPKTSNAVCTTAVASITTSTPTNTVALLTAGANGALVTRVTAIPRNTITATGIYLFISRDSGTTKFLVDSEYIPAYTAATTTAYPETWFNNILSSQPMRLAAGDILYVGIGVTLTDGVVFLGEWTDF